MTALHVNRFKTVSSLGDNELEERVTLFTGDDCESITDKTLFVPESEALRKLKSGQSQPFAGEELNYFDFPDGKPNMRHKFPVARMKGADLAEISQAIKSEQGAISEKVAKTQQEQVQRAAFEQRLNDTASKLSGSARSTASN